MFHWCRGALPFLCGHRHAGCCCFWLREREDSLHCLLVSFDKPEPGIAVARDVGEESRTIRINAFRCLSDRVPNMFAVGSKDRCKSLDMAVPVGDLQRIRVKRRSASDDGGRSIGTAPQLHDTLGNQVNILLDATSNVTE